MALPERFVERFREIHPDDADTLLKTFERPRKTAFRINPIKISVEEALERLRAEGFEPEPVGWYPYAFTLPPEARPRLARTELFNEGAIYIQSLSSMLAPLVLEPKPGETVLDLAAAPGGKSLMIAAMMENDGWLSVVEPGKDRFFRLKANLECGGVTIAHYYMTDGRAVGNKTPERFDRVLLDAPCSTESKFRADDPETYAYWSERKIKEMAKLQQRLLASAVKALKPGGTLLYATCSFAPEENEAVVDKALRRHPELCIQPLDLPVENVRPGLTEWRGKSFHPDIVHTVRVLPNERMDGFYLCKFTKEDRNG